MPDSCRDNIKPLVSIRNWEFLEAYELHQLSSRLGRSLF